MEKFNKGDLVELPTGVRVFVAERIGNECALAIGLEGYASVVCDKSQLKLIKPAKQYITVNGHKVPKPLIVKPENMATYYLVSLDVDLLYDEFKWDGSRYDQRIFDRGLCYKNKEDAIAMSKALLSAIPKEGK